MSDTFFIRPADPAARIPDPGRAAPLPCPADGSGIERPRDAYWLRHLQHGDVVEVPFPVPAEADASSLSNS